MPTSSRKLRVGGLSAPEIELSSFSCMCIERLGVPAQEARTFEQSFRKTFPIVERSGWNHGLLCLALVIVFVLTFGMPVLCHKETAKTGKVYKFYLCDDRGFTAPTLSYFISVGGGAGVYSLAAFTPIVLTFLWNLELRIALRILRSRLDDVTRLRNSVDDISEEDSLTEDSLPAQLRTRLQRQTCLIDAQYYLVLMFTLGFYGIVCVPTTFAAGPHILIATTAAAFLGVQFMVMLYFDFHILPGIMYGLGLFSEIAVAVLLFAVGVNNKPGQVASWPHPYNYTYWFLEATGFACFLTIPLAYFFTVSAEERVGFLLDLPMSKNPMFTFDEGSDGSSSE